MDLSELVRSRRTVHNYKPEKISDALVMEALQLSLWAPNHKRTFPWAYFWTGPSTRSQLADLSVELRAAKEPLNDIKTAAARDNVLNPSHMILIGTKLEDPKRAHEDYATLACSVQIAALYLWSLGIGSKWSTGGYSTHAKTYEILGVSPEQIRLEGAMMIGIPSLTPPVPERPPLETFLHKTT